VTREFKATLEIQACLETLEVLEVQVLRAIQVDLVPLDQMENQGYPDCLV
jgi:hypothetical protein